MSNLENELSAHFAALESVARSHREAQDAEHKKGEQHRMFVADKMEKALAPEFYKVRDILLSRNFPAVTAMVPDVHPGYHAAVVGVYCSNRIEDAQQSSEGMPFYAAYVLDGGKVQFKTNRAANRKEKDYEVVADVALADLTAADARRRLIEFVKAAYPVVTS